MIWRTCLNRALVHHARMTMAPYLSFKGDCEAAFQFYQSALNGKVGELFRYGGSPMENEVPTDWKNRIMHGSVTIGGQTVMGADTAPEKYERPQGFSLALNIHDAGDAERMFRALANGGKVIVALEKTFWAERFGIVIDRFGIPWAINCESQ
jgi:PhnB protein